jgi:hypothetical protein
MCKFYQLVSETIDIVIRMMVLVILIMKGLGISNVVLT